MRDLPSSPSLRCARVSVRQRGSRPNGWCFCSRGDREGARGARRCSCLPEHVLRSGACTSALRLCGGAACPPRRDRRRGRDARRRHRLCRLVAAVLGLLLARYREIFFAMLSLAFSMILYGLLVKSSTLGSTGRVQSPRQVLRRHRARRRRRAPRVLRCRPSRFSASAGRCIATSAPTGAALSIRDNELRVEYLGASVYRVVYVNRGRGCARGPGRRVRRAGRRPCRSGNGVLDDLGRVRVHRHPCRPGNVLARSSRRRSSRRCAPLRAARPMSGRWRSERRCSRSSCSSRRTVDAAEESRRERAAFRRADSTSAAP